MGKHREFWITIDDMSAEPATNIRPFIDHIHVIEIEAVRELEAKLKIATEALEYYRSEDTWKIGYYGLENNPAPAIWTRDDDCGKRANEAIRKIRGEG